MRDGTKLYTVLVMKKGTKNAPILLTRSPYDAHADAFRNASQRIDDILPMRCTRSSPTTATSSSIQDIRGLHRSQGTFIMTRPIAGPLNKTGIDESTDAYDTIDWLVKNVPEIQRPGRHHRLLLSRLHHPDERDQPASGAQGRGAGKPDGRHLDRRRRFTTARSGSPRSTISLEMSTDKADAGTRFRVGRATTTRVYLDAGSLADFARKWHIENVPFVRKVMDNPAYTDFWQLQAVDKWFAARPLTVPTMLEVGQWDQEDSYGAPAVYRALKDKYEGSGLLHLTIGPWRHSGANHYGYELGALTFTGDTAKEWRTKWMKPFLDHYLKGTPDPHTPRSSPMRPASTNGRRARAGRWARRRRSI